MTVEAVGLPTTVLGELTRLSEGGSLTPADVVEAARPRTSVLHPLFTWDNKLAAEEHRLGQARDLIRRYKVRVVSGPDTGEARASLVRGFTAASRAGIEAPTGTYVPTLSLTGSQREAVLRTMAREIAGLRRNYQQYPEFWQIITELASEGPAAAASGG